MALGVLIDALFVRPLLIPALIALVGRSTWWPSRLRPATVSARLLLRGGRAPRSRTVRTPPTSATRRSPRWPSGSRPARRSELARQLPDELATSVAGVEHAQPLSRDEYVERVADRARVGTHAAEHDARVVVSVLASMLADGEIEYLRAALPADYAWLFGDAPHQPERPALAASR